MTCSLSVGIGWPLTGESARSTTHRGCRLRRRRPPRSFKASRKVDERSIPESGDVTFEALSRNVLKELIRKARRDTRSSSSSGAPWARRRRTSTAGPSKASRQDTGRRWAPRGREALGEVGPRRSRRCDTERTADDRACRARLQEGTEAGGARRMFTAMVDSRGAAWVRSSGRWRATSSAISALPHEQASDDRRAEFV